MREYIQVQGGTSLKGSVKVGGAKNAVLPMLMASLLTSEKITYTNVPDLRDVYLSKCLLENFGAEIEHKQDKLEISVPKLLASEASYSLVKAMRASFWVLGPLLARGGAARVALPGGDLIGARPVDLHIEGLTAMGADIKVKHGVVYATAENGLRPVNYSLRFPSVGATHQLLLAASLIPGLTTLSNVAREPEVSALANLLCKMGCQIEGIGTSELKILGQDQLHGAEVEIIGDRIEAATYLLAAAVTGGNVETCGIQPEHLGSFLDILKEMGVDVATKEDSIRVSLQGRLKAINVSTEPFPGLATDMQAPLMAALSVADGTSKIEEKIFEGRFGHVAELNRMGAEISIEDRVASIKGVDKLSAAPVEGQDIRGAVAMIIAALAADGISEIYEVQHLRRGYSHLEDKFRSLGAHIGTHIKDAEDYLFVGC